MPKPPWKTPSFPPPTPPSAPPLPSHPLTPPPTSSPTSLRPPSPPPPSPPSPPSPSTSPTPTRPWEEAQNTLPPNPSDIEGNLPDIFPITDANDPSYSVVKEAVNPLYVPFDPDRPWPKSKHNQVHVYLNPTGNLNEPVHDTIPEFFSWPEMLEAMYVPLTEEEEAAVLEWRSILPAFRTPNPKRSINVVDIKRNVFLTNKDPSAPSTTFLEELDFTGKAIARLNKSDPPKRKELIGPPELIAGPREKAREEYKKAKEEWRAAVASRKEILRQWDDYVTQLRERMWSLDPKRQRRDNIDSDDDVGV